MRKLFDHAALRLHGHRQGKRRVSYRVRRHLDTPTPAQASESGTSQLIAQPEHVARDGCLRCRVDQKDRPAAAQEVLINHPFLPAGQRGWVRKE